MNALQQLTLCTRGFITDTCVCRSCRVRRFNAELAQAVAAWQAQR